MKLWQIAVLVIAGVLYGVFDPGRLTYAFGHATLYVFLPPLLFEAAWGLNFRALRQQWAAIAVLAGPGVLLTAIIVAGALAVVRVPFGAALLIGAILSATDPIAVVAIFRRLRVPITLATIVESEALFNDGAAVVLYRGIILALAAGPQLGSLVRVTVDSLLGVASGVVLGIGIAFIAALFLRGKARSDVQIVATLICAYGAYFLADSLHCSGIFATIATAIALRRFERSWITLHIAADVNAAWDIGALVANAFVFFLVGAALRVNDLGHNSIFIIATIAGVLIARGIVVGLLLPSALPRDWLDVIRVAGLRGALSLALAIALPASMPYRESIVDVTFAVVLMSLIFGGAAVVPVVARIERRAS
jgi:CPA1 family monovalent cation:H+ antiporter